MTKFTLGLAIGASLMIAGVVPSMAQQRYATDPDPFVYSRLGQEHRALSHSSAVLPRTSAPKGSARTAGGAAYATDPDIAIYSRLNQEHFALSHSNAVLPRNVVGARALGPFTAGPSISSGGVSGNYTRDPDPRIQSKLSNERNVF